MSRDSSESRGTDPINTAAVNALRLAKAVTSEERLLHAQLAEYPQPEQAQYLARRQRFLDEWHALIELGGIAPPWGTYGQRLDYVGECADREHAEWAEEAGLKPAALSQLRQRVRSESSHTYEDSTVVRKTYRLIKAAGQPIDLAWVLGGSNPVDEREFRARYIWTIKRVFGDGPDVLDEARKAGLYPEEAVKYESSDEQQALAAALSMRSKSIFSATWLLTGRAQPPEGVRAAMETMRNCAASSPMRNVTLDDFLYKKKAPTELIELITPEVDRRTEDHEHQWETETEASQSVEEFIRENRAMVFLLAHGGASRLPATARRST